MYRARDKAGIRRQFLDLVSEYHEASESGKAGFAGSLSTVHYAGRVFELPTSCHPVGGTRPWTSG
ncbi:MAG: hypothetical protein QM757_04055 [Paludibaculum sp.]